MDLDIDQIRNYIEEGFYKLDQIIDGDHYNREILWGILDSFFQVNNADDFVRNVVDKVFEFPIGGAIEFSLKNPALAEEVLNSHQFNNSRFFISTLKKYQPNMNVTLMLKKSPLFIESAHYLKTGEESILRIKRADGLNVDVFLDQRSYLYMINKLFEGFSKTGSANIYEDASYKLLNQVYHAMGEFFKDPSLVEGGNDE